MTDTVKDFLAALDRLENDALASRDGYGYSSGDAETIRRVLAENEQLRKERDELERRLNDRSEWFFRWIARGKGGSLGMSMEQCADMIWHHPDNPYADYNPWDKLAKKVNENA